MIERKHALGGASSGRRRFVTTFVVLLPCSLPVPYRLFATMSAAAKNVFIVAVRSAVRAHGVADSPHMLRLPVAAVLHRPSVPRSAASVASSRTCLPRTWEPTRRRLRSLLARCAHVVLPDCVRTADVCTDCTHRLTPAWWTLASSATSPRPFVLAHLHPAARSTCSYLVVALQSQDAAYLARHIALKAGAPIESTALTVNRLCGSGFQALVSGTQEILLGESNVALVGGTESMSQAPMAAYGHKVRFGTALGQDLQVRYCRAPFAACGRETACRACAHLTRSAPVGRAGSWWTRSGQGLPTACARLPWASPLRTWRRSTT